MVCQRCHGQPRRRIIGNSFGNLRGTIYFIARRVLLGRGCTLTYFLFRFRPQIDIHVYPAHSAEEGNPVLGIVVTILVGCIFLGVFALFLVYDSRVSKRQIKLLSTATNMYSIVSGLFPKIVKDRMLSITATKGNKPTGIETKRDLITSENAPIAGKLFSVD